MSTFVIEGGRPLSGEITPQGAKNEALQIISATLLTSQPVVVSNIPEILDIMNLISLLKDIGVNVERHAKGEYTFTARNINEFYIHSADFVSKCAKLRGSVLVVGPLLARFGQAFFPKPGGDKIGRRRVDTHIDGFMRLGAKCSYDTSRKAYNLSSGLNMKGCYMLLDEASVTGTANLVMAASLAEGTTTIYNAACEPYLQQLCKMLVRMGAKIEGIGSNLLTITGVKELNGTHHRILPDMIEVGSFIGMAAITRSSLTIKDVSWVSLCAAPVTLRLGIRETNSGLTLGASSSM